MLGAIIGDIVGSRFEWDNIKTKEFEFFTKDCFPTDDSYMTLALAQAILNCDGDYTNLSEEATKLMQEVGKKYPDAGYGRYFYAWIFSEDPKPYNSCGNGSAMRVSPCGFVAKSLDEAILLSKKVTEITHDHPEGIKGAEATAVAIYLARTGKTKEEIKDYIVKNYYDLDFTIDGIRDTYRFDGKCQGTVPQSLEAFFESTDFEDAIRNVISIGGDSDTLAAITGAVAQAYYGIPKNIIWTALSYLDDFCLDIFEEFGRKFF